MRELLKILLGAFAVFMALAIGQEWELFSSAWFGGGKEAAESSTTDEASRAAVETVHQALAIMAHLYASDGDSRFAERLPAAESLVDELLADIEYLRRNRRRQESSLERLEITSIERLGEGRVEIRTREWWRHRILWAGTKEEAEASRTQTVLARYLVAKRSQQWRVEWWEIARRVDG